MLALFSRKMDAYRLYLVMMGASSVFITFVFAVNMVYQVETVGLSPLQLVLVGTALEAAVFLFEVPTGIVADVYSRRLSIIIGYGLMGGGFLLEGAVPSFEAILLAQVVWGVGYTFTSGAHQAWIADEIGEDRVGRVFLRAAQIGSLVGIPATLLAITIGSVQVNLPILLGGALHIILALFLALVMPETGFQPVPRESRSAAGQMSTTLRAGLRLVRRRPVLVAILGIGFFYGLYSEGFDRLWTAHLLESFALPDFGGLQPVAWMGLLSMAGGLLALALFGFAAAGSFAAAVLLRWAISILRTLIEPLQTTWINQHLDSDVRATVISMSGQVDAIGQIAGGPPVGWVGGVLGLRAALFASAALLLPVLPLYMRVLRRGRPAEAEAPAGD